MTPENLERLRAIGHRVKAGQLSLPGDGDRVLDLVRAIEGQGVKLDQVERSLRILQGHIESTRKPKPAPVLLTEVLGALNTDALLLEPRALYDEALVGVTCSPVDHWPRKPGVFVAVYSADLCIALIAADHDARVGPDEDVYQMAVDHFDFNVSGGWVGDGTPTFVQSVAE